MMRCLSAGLCLGERGGKEERPGVERMEGRRGGGKEGRKEEGEGGRERG